MKGQMLKTLIIYSKERFMKKGVQCVCAGFGCLLIFGCLEQPSVGEEKAPRPVMVLPVSEVIDRETKTFTGVVQSAERSTLAFRVPGRIDEIPVKEGQLVKEGDLLGRLDPHDYELAVTLERARLKEAKAANKLALAEFKRIEKAARSNAVAAVKLERAESVQVRSGAIVDVVQQSLQKAENSLSYTRLTAPFGGVVGEIYPNVYEQVLPGVPILELHQPESIEAVIDVPERLIAKFGVGQFGTLSWYGSDHKIQAYVVEISSVPNPASRTYTVTFRIPEQTQGLVPGKSVVVSVPFDQTEDSIAIPYEALLQEDDQASVFIVEDSKAVLRSVEIVRFLEKRVCVRGRLDADTVLVIAGVHFLTDGQTVGKQIPVQ